MLVRIESGALTPKELNVATFEYRDSDGNNELNVKASFHIGCDGKGFSLDVTTGDDDGAVYFGYIPNHRESLTTLAHEILAAVEQSKDEPLGFDGFITNAATATATNDEDEWDKAGVVDWF